MLIGYEMIAFSQIDAMCFGSYIILLKPNACLWNNR